MYKWKSFGVSIIGPGHKNSNVPNQDFFIEKHTKIFDCVVVADGMGSRKNSQVAAKTICKSVIKATESLIKQNNKFSIKKLITEIKKIFYNSLSYKKFKEDKTTCLIALHIYNKIFLCMLGDGLIAVVLNNNKIKKIVEDKSKSFSNITKTISKTMTLADWEILSVSDKKCKSILLCTDGISDDIVDIDNFVIDFSNNFANNNISKKNKIKEISNLLINWPVPKHSDDKTIAYVYKIKGKK